MQWPVNNMWQLVSVATDMHATIAQLLETVFSIWSALRLYSEHERDNLVKNVGVFP
jgi:hypothetical protein